MFKIWDDGALETPVDKMKIVVPKDVFAKSQPLRDDKGRLAGVVAEVTKQLKAK